MSHTTRRQLTLAIIVLTVLGVLPVSAQSINEDMKIVATDAAENDRFGNSVAISGTTAIVGAVLDDGVGLKFIFNSGSAYLFDTETGLQITKLTASDATRLDNFGGSVAISGTTAIVGATGDDDAGDNSGSAYLFDTVTGLELFKLTASDAAESKRFGVSVAISGTTAIVGAYWDDHMGARSGSAYLFDSKTGDQLAKLTASDAAADDQFGKSVAIYGTTAIVGARLDDDGSSSSGSAYLFDTVTGQQLFKLTASDAAEGDYFGTSVAIWGTTAIIGAYRDDGTDPIFDSGSAYLFDTTTGNQIAKLTASDAATQDWFGTSVAISGTTVIVRAFKDDVSSGSAYLFDTVTGLQIAKLTASDAAAHDQFGAIAISGTTVIVGASNDDDGGSDSGSAYVFNLPTPCSADLTGEGDLNFSDISVFLVAFGAQDPVADFEFDGSFNFFDVSAFLVAYGAGCP